eukprot:scaffold71750_cov30-Tisochrysis_lutea.AAC.1
MTGRVSTQAHTYATMACACSAPSKLGVHRAARVLACMPRDDGMLALDVRHNANKSVLKRAARLVLRPKSAKVGAPRWSTE